MARFQVYAASHLRDHCMPIPIATENLGPAETQLDAAAGRAAAAPRLAGCLPMLDAPITKSNGLWGD